MEVHILTIFPTMFVSPLDASILKRALERCLLRVHVHNIRDFTSDRHRVTDDYPYGGGAGMIMKPEPIVAGIQAIQERFGPTYSILLSPQGQVLTQDVVTKHNDSLEYLAASPGVKAKRVPSADRRP